MAVSEGDQLFTGDGRAASSSSSSATQVPVTSPANFATEKPQKLGSDDNVRTRASSISGRDPSLLISEAGTQTPTRDDQWTSSDEKEEDDERNTVSRNLARTETNMSIADTLSLPREILFVMVICFGQLFTRTLTPTPIFILSRCLALLVRG